MQHQISPNVTCLAPNRHRTHKIWCQSMLSNVTKVHQSTSLNLTEVGRSFLGIPWCSPNLTYWALQKSCSALNLICLQLRTIKDIQFCISGTRIFWEKLLTDLNSDGQIELKNGVFIKFPRVFVAAKFLDQISDTFRSVLVAGRVPDLHQQSNDCPKIFAKTCSICQDL